MFVGFGWGVIFDSRLRDFRSFSDWETSPSEILVGGCNPFTNEYLPDVDVFIHVSREKY